VPYLIFVGYVVKIIVNVDRRLARLICQAVIKAIYDGRYNLAIREYKLYERIYGGSSKYRSKPPQERAKRCHQQHYITAARGEIARVHVRPA
jgi:hypothetical protein